ncbi:hypothetical protein CK203_012463 [Vitis vinifera]|uniref:Uncharacterized protein n=1 Tax=Vitis vinifera TaxID=29760 RepID=A0A438JKW8_VITVI|nr:hypothetical protein CK203_012463 [Vitis vinifera]
MLKSQNMEGLAMVANKGNDQKASTIDNKRTDWSKAFNCDNRDNLCCTHCQKPRHTRENVENFMVSQLHLAKSGVNNQSMSRLNRFLVNEGWDYHFSGSIQCVFLRPVFDHFPVLLDGGGMRRGPSPFRFENMWLKVEGFKDLLKLKWGAT